MNARALILAALVASPLVAAGQTAAPTAQSPTGERPAAATTLDYEFFKNRVQPIFLQKRPGHARCMECHDTGTPRLQALSPGDLMARCSGPMIVSAGRSSAATSFLASLWSDFASVV